LSEFFQDDEAEKEPSDEGYEAFSAGYSAGFEAGKQRALELLSDRTKTTFKLNFQP